MAVMVYSLLIVLAMIGLLGIQKNESVYFYGPRVVEAPWMVSAGASTSQHSTTS